MINVFEIWSRYLFNQNQAPIGDDLLNEKYVRDSGGSVKGDTIKISSLDFKNTYGKFVSAADFGSIKKFFDSQVNGLYSYQSLLNFHIENKNSDIKIDGNGVISFGLKELINMSLGGDLSANILARYGQKTISQTDYYIENESAYDLALRVQMFQTTGFVIGNSLEGGEGFDTYKTDGKLTVMDEDGKGILFYKNKNLLGAEMRYKSDNLTPPSALDFSSKGYDINDKSTDRLVEIARTDKYVRYIVTGDTNFKYKDLTTEALDTRSKNDADLGIKFYVTVYKDIPPPPFIPPPTPPTKYDPLVLDLNYDGKISTTPLGTDIYFDLDGNSFAEKTSWVQATDGFVVLDLNENGKIDSGKELFGTDTVLPDGSKASDGFKALAQYDLNKDGVINSDDEIYQKIKIWRDINQDGVSQSNELFTLSSLGINSISLKNQVVNAADENNVIHTNQGSFTQSIFENGEIKIKNGLAETLLFEVNTSETIWQNPNDNNDVIDSDILELPDFPGYGSAKSLHNAMQLDQTGILKGLVSSFALTSSEEQIFLTHQILYFWTNSKTSTATSVNNISSSEKFEIIKVMYGKEIEWKNWSPAKSFMVKMAMTC